MTFIYVRQLFLFAPNICLFFIKNKFYPFYHMKRNFVPIASAYNVTGLIVIKIRAVADAGKCRVGMYAIFARYVRHPRRVSSRSRRGIGSIFFGGVYGRPADGGAGCDWFN